MSDVASHESPRLVFGDDGSRGADIAWLWINNHSWRGWRIDVLTGAEPPYSPSMWGTQAVATRWQPPWGRQYFDESELAGIEFSNVLADPRLVLDEQRDADLVVVGHAGHGHLRSSWMGSTAEWLLHHPTAPLALVRSASKVERVLCCVDGSEPASRAIDAFARLPLASECEVVVSSVADGRVDVDAAIERAVGRLASVPVDARIDRAEGKPSRVILEQIDALQPQLVVLGTKGLTGWSRLRVGSTASAVVHHVTCNCLVACTDDDPEAGDLGALASSEP